MSVQKCKRRRVIINKQHYYLVVGSDFVLCTVPRENDPVMSGERMIIETLCEHITELLTENATAGP